VVGVCVQGVLVVEVEGVRVYGGVYSQSYGGGKPGKNVLVLLVSCTYRKRVASIHRAAESGEVRGNSEQKRAGVEVKAPSPGQRDRWNLASSLSPGSSLSRSVAPGAAASSPGSAQA
jgi:hypothetical protein